MSTTNVAALDRTVHQTQAWLGHIADDLGWEDHDKTYSALRAVLHTLRDRLPPDEAADLAAQLPMLVRGIYFEGWHPSDKPLRYQNREEFLDRVRRAAPKLQADETERAVAAVFRELSTELDWGEVEEAREAVPREVRALWPDADG
jgi:uncharacterized protein (DUF2267 family)